jgi:hypothetical protein
MVEKVNITSLYLAMSAKYFNKVINIFNGLFGFFMKFLFNRSLEMLKNYSTQRSLSSLE